MLQKSLRRVGLLVTNMAASGKFFEEELGKKWDRCLTDGVIKLGGGLGVGAVVSLLFFRLFIILTNHDAYVHDLPRLQHHFEESPSFPNYPLCGNFVIIFIAWRMWPIFTGAGFGIGMAYANCERDINSTVTVTPEPASGQKPPPAKK